MSRRRQYTESSKALHVHPGAWLLLQHLPARGPRSIIAAARPPWYCTHQHRFDRAGIQGAAPSICILEVRVAPCRPGKDSAVKADAAATIGASPAKGTAAASDLAGVVGSCKQLLGNPESQVWPDHLLPGASPVACGSAACTAPSANTAADVECGGSAAAALPMQQHVTAVSTSAHDSVSWQAFQSGH